MPRPYTDVSTILRSRNRDLKTTHNTFRVVTCTFTFFCDNLSWDTCIPLNITASLSPNGSQAMERTHPPKVTDPSVFSQVCGIKSAHLTARRAPFATVALRRPSSKTDIENFFLCFVISNCYFVFFNSITPKIW